MPYFPILQKPTQNNLITKTSFLIPAECIIAIGEKTAEERIAPLVAMHHRQGEKTAEERFNMLARGWLAYPVTPTHHPSTAEERLYKRQHMVGLHSLVAERRHSSVTRYAKRSVACRDSPRHQPLRAGGTPLPHLSAVASHIVRHHPSDCPIGAIHHHAKNRRRAV